MKRILAALTMALAAAAAFALPAPAQIEDALATQHYSDARSMINEVLRERPDSARAHLLNSYVLVHVDHNRAAANAELETAKGLDKRGDVKSSPLFGRVVAEIGATAPAKPASSKATPAPDGEHAGRVLLIFLGLVALGIGLYLIVRILSDRPAGTRVVFVGGGGGYSGPSAAVGGGPGGPGGPWLGSGGNGVLVQQPVFAQQPAPQPMGALGTAASVAGGVVAGNAISDLLHSRSGSRRDDDWEPRASRSAPAPDASPVSYESERSSFSSSSSGSSDWGGSSSSSSSSSDWGSSSSDSSSSFSSDSSSDW